MPVTLDNYMDDNLVVVVDIETTGFSPENSCIIEIGICTLNLDNGETQFLFDKLIKEPNFSEKHRNEWIFNNSDMNFDEIMAANPLEDYKIKLQKIFDKYPATAYNKRFDFNFLIHRGFKIRELPCPMIAATNIIKLLPYKPNTQYKWPSVEESWHFYFPNKNYIEKHRGYDDAIHEAKIVYEMYKRKEWMPTEEK
ncbi:MAG: 3'-5' exonuclease [archaeon]|nr:3'-5' exonuclease [archaeon]